MASPEKKMPEPEAKERRDSSSSNTYRRSIFGVPVTVTISIGQTRMSVSEVLALQPESIVPLTSRIDDPVSLAIDNTLIAKGELVETDDGSLAVKIIEILEQSND